MTDGDPNHWDNDAVLSWLGQKIEGTVITSNALDNVREHNICGSDLFLLEREDWKDLGVTRIPDLRRLMLAIEALKKKRFGRQGHQCYSSGRDDDNEDDDNDDDDSVVQTSAVDECPGLLDLLGGDDDDFVNELLDTTLPVSSDAAYWRRVEVLFALRLIVLRTTEELAAAVCLRKKANRHPCCCPGGDMEKSASAADGNRTHEIVKRRTIVQNLLRNVQSSIAELHSNNSLLSSSSSSSSLDNTNDDDDVDRDTSSWKPIFAKMAETYDCSDAEIDVVQFVVVVKTTRSRALRALIPTEQNSIMAEECSSALIQYVCGLSQIQVSQLTEDSHPLLQDRILAVDQEDFIGTGFKFNVPDEVCRAFLGELIGTEDRLKLSGTRLLSIVEALKSNDGATNDNETSHYDHAEEGQMRNEKVAVQTTVSNLLGNLKIGGGNAPSEREILPDEIEEESSWIKDAEAASPDDDIDGSNYDDVAVEILEATDAKHNEEKEFNEGSSSIDVVSSRRTSLSQQAAEVAINEKGPRPYTCELDYLSDLFSLVMQQIQIANQRHEKDLKEASIETKPHWMKSNEGKKKSSIGELSAKVKLAERKIEINLELTRREGTFYPRLEELCTQLELSSFEKSVLIYLSGSMISPLFKSSIVSDSYRGSGRKCTVGDLLLVFCESVSEQVTRRTHFYRTSKLVEKGLVRVCDMYGGSDLTDLEVQLDRRVLDCIVGLDKESTEIVQGSYLYDPTVDINSVVLAPGLKETIIASITSFDKFMSYRKQRNFDEVISYGVGLTLMFCGASGTGKTMMANAIAAKVGKKLLLVDFPRLAEANGKESSSYQSIFREAELSNAILFFDECESLFAKRDSVVVNRVTELLTQLERFEGISLLATNRPFDLDEAMYRRINEVFEFKAPNHVERRKIWNLVTSNEAIPCDKSIDWDAIALKYELTGGYIKNAVLAALLTAIGRDANTPTITESDIVEGCKKQMRGALQMKDFDERVVPSSGLDDLIVSNTVRDQLKDIVQVEKARGILFGIMGFDDSMRLRQGTTALFWGPRGSGKSRAAEAIGFELGKPLKVVDFPQLLGRSGKANATAVQDCFKEAGLMDAVLVLGGLSMHSDGRGNGPTTEDTRLLNIVVREMTRFQGTVILMVDSADSRLDMLISQLEKGLLDGLKFSVQFDLPNLACREMVWKKLLPESMPSKGIDFKVLAQSSDKLNFVQIGNAVYRAAACAALKPEMERWVKMSDLKTAIDEERLRGESAAERWAKSQYL